MSLEDEVEQALTDLELVRTTQKHFFNKFARLADKLKATGVCSHPDKYQHPLPDMYAVPTNFCTLCQSAAPQSQGDSATQKDWFSP